ncbi:DUF3833 domain-containing protein [Vibrio cholerae]|uniref:DUF3833 domain-containing protein n=1 Tax=Vibrio cholerae TaxID=666 RepID=UPI00158150DA|nr:DUF3833 domain-containing protein [Vibrio cholerae]QKU56125.1 DUF3833 domain-containing protein [Vibrio cholerae]
MRLAKCWLLLLCIWLSGCSAEIDDYRATTPKFDLFNYFVGTKHAWGMVQDYTEKQTRRFEVVIEGRIENNQLILVEDFVFDDGEKDQRIWTINRTADDEYEGQADDIVGTARGKEVGNALQWQYDFVLKLDSGDVQVHFDDWLYRQDDKRVFNLTKIRKFGLEVGRITLFFEKHE